MADTVSDPRKEPRALLARLATLADCAGAEGFACISARHEHGARSVDIERPQLAIVLEGRKQVRDTMQDLAFAPGDLLLMARRCRLDVVNLPDAGTGRYRTITVPLCEEVLDATRLLWAEPVTGNGGPDIARLDLIAFAEPLLQWRAALQAGHYGEARLALAALVVALCRRGHTGLLLPAPPSLAARVRELVATQPERDWRSHDFEHAFGLSGATLRRRLADENTGLRDEIVSARLACAMQWLYTTRWPVKTVAARVGYRSAASFVRRFRDRYGLDPGRIGNAED